MFFILIVLKIGRKRMINVLFVERNLMIKLFIRWLLLMLLLHFNDIILVFSILILLLLLLWDDRMPLEGITYINYYNIRTKI